MKTAARFAFCWLAIWLIGTLPGFAQDQKPVATIPFSSQVGSIGLTPDGKFAAAAGRDDNFLTFLQLPSGKEAKKLNNLQPRSGEKLVFHPDGKSVTLICQEQIDIYNLATGKRTATTKTSFFGAAWTPTATVVVGLSFAQPKDAIVWDVAKAKEQGRIKTAVDFAKTAAITSDGKKVALAEVATKGDDDFSQVKLWDANTGKELLALENPVKGKIGSLALSKDDKVLAAAVDSGGHLIRLWDAATGKELRTIKDVSSDDRLVFSPDGKMIAAASNSRVIVWDTATGNKLATLIEGPGLVWDIKFSLDGKLLLSASEAKNVKIWDVASFAPSK